MARLDTEPTTLDEQAPADPGVPSEIVGRTPRQLFWRRFKKDRWAIAGGITVLVIIFLAIFGAPLAERISGHGLNESYIYSRLDEFGQPYGPTLSAEFVPPEPRDGRASSVFIFGSDGLGRDVLVRILYGARTSLTVALLATVIELSIGITLGLISGFYRGKVDTGISRFTDVVLTLPVLLLAIGLGFACGSTAEGCLGGLIRPGIPLVSLIIGLFSWPYISRIIRGQVLSMREKEFVQASKALGASNRRTIWREVLPNVVAPIIVYTTLVIPVNILFEAGLTFLGVGVPSEIPSWGRMLDEASGVFDTQWWLMVFPGIFLFATTLGFNLFGDGLRDAFDPRSGDTP
jgi:peptide/nickel transport system permease protein